MCVIVRYFSNEPFILKYSYYLHVGMVYHTKTPPNLCHVCVLLELRGT
jgi:hypothetical protein